MPAFPYTVTIERPNAEAETFQVVADSRDMRAYEAETGESFFGETTYTQVCKLAWLAARRTGKFVGSWESFDAAALEVQDDEDADQGAVDPPVPTRKVRAPRRSSS